MEKTENENKDKSSLRSTLGPRGDDAILCDDRNIKKLNPKALVNIGRSAHSKTHGKRKKYY